MKKERGRERGKGGREEVKEKEEREGEERGRERCGKMEIGSENEECVSAVGKEKEEREEGDG